MIKSISYQDFSVVYDEYLAHVDYSMWANYILKLWHLEGRNRPQRNLDMACSAGEIMKYLAGKKISCWGFDAATPFLCAEYYAGTRGSEKIGEVIVNRESSFDEDRNLLITKHEFPIQDSSNIKVEYHYQNIFDHFKLNVPLRNCGFNKVENFSDFSTKQGIKEDAMRIHYLAIK